ncbi:MAG: DNA repair protein RecO [Patescibacteria group bacterium]
MHTRAIILKKIPIREYDTLVICYTQDAGKQVYQAKSIMKPTSKQAGHLDILSLVGFSLAHKNNYPIITSAYCLEAFPYLKSSLVGMSAAFFLLECFEKLIFENEPDSKLWGFLLTQLQRYNAVSIDLLQYPLEGQDTNSIWRNIITDTRQELLRILGYDPSYPIEQLANTKFNSLQFARKVLK